jgi:hypothetical protein
MARFGNAAGRPQPPALGVFLPAGSQYGLKAQLPKRYHGVGSTPALSGMFQAGPVVQLSKIQTMATNVRRGP